MQRFLQMAVGLVAVGVHCGATAYFPAVYQRYGFPLERPRCRYLAYRQASFGHDRLGTDLL